MDLAREAVSSAFGCLFGEVVFTSSGTESANLAVLGPALAARGGRRRRILLGAAEHHCVLHCRPVLESWDYEVVLVPVDSESRYRHALLEELVDESTFLVSLMHANNETGAVSDIARLASVAKGRGALFHTDAVQTFPGGWRVGEVGADLVSVSAHKFGGPTGVGALNVRGGTPIEPMARGGGQERDLRAGTEPVAAIVGMAAALAARRDVEPVRNARDLFVSKLVEAGFVPTVSGVGPTRDETDKGLGSFGTVLPGHAHGRFPGVSAESMLIRLDRLGVSASSGSACSSGSLEPNHVALAMGWTLEEAREALRFTFGHGATLALAEEAARRVILARDEILAAGRA